MGPVAGGDVLGRAMNTLTGKVVDRRKKTRRSWGNAEAGARPKIAIVQKPCYLESTCGLPYEALVEAINAGLPQKKSKIFHSTRPMPAGTFQWYVFH